MIALSSHTRVAFIGVGRVGALPPWLWRVRRSPRLGGIWGASAQRVTEHRALRVTEPSTLRCAEYALCESPSPAEPRALYPPSLLYSATLPGMPPPQALIYSLTASPPSTSPASAPPLPHTSPTILTLTHSPLYLSDYPHPHSLSFSFYISHYALVACWPFAPGYAFYFLFPSVPFR